MNTIMLIACLLSTRFLAPAEIPGLLSLRYAKRMLAMPSVNIAMYVANISQKPGSLPDLPINYE